MTSRLALALASALSLAAAPATFAQEAQEKLPATLELVEPAEGISNETLDDAKIRSFVEALAAIQIVANRYMPRIEAETDGAKRAALIDKANSSIVRAIHTIANITPAEYKAIDIAAQADEALSQRIMAEIEEAKAEAAEAQSGAPEATEEKSE